MDSQKGRALAAEAPGHYRARSFPIVGVALLFLGTALFVASLKVGEVLFGLLVLLALLALSMVLGNWGAIRARPAAIYQNGFDLPDAGISVSFANSEFPEGFVPYSRIRNWNRDKVGSKTMSVGIQLDNRSYFRLRREQMGHETFHELVRMLEDRVGPPEQV